MAEIKRFRSLILGTITCDVMLCEGSIGDVHEAVSHLCGHPVWTHEIGLYADDAASEILRQFPGFPSGKPDDWRTCAEDIVKRFGEFLDVQAGTGERDANPLETLQVVAPHAQVIIVDIGEKGDVA